MSRLSLNIHGTVRVEMEEKSCTRKDGTTLVWTDIICYDRNGDSETVCLMDVSRNDIANALIDDIKVGP
jgi:hypothetical protein